MFRSVAFGSTCCIVAMLAGCAAASATFTTTETVMSVPQHSKCPMAGEEVVISDALTHETLAIARLAPGVRQTATIPAASRPAVTTVCAYRLVATVPAGHRHYLMTLDGRSTPAREGQMRNGLTLFWPQFFSGFQR